MAARRPPSSPPYWKAAAPALAAALTTAMAAGLLAAALRSLPGLPYNLREALGDSLPAALARGFALAATVLLLGAAPLLAARLVPLAAAPGPALRRAARLTRLAAAPLIALLLLLAAPAESAQDLAGSPVWRTLPAVEIWLRLTGLLLPPLGLLLLTAAVLDGWRLLGGAGAWAGAWRQLPWVLTAVLLGRTVVVTFACTDNLLELIRGGQAVLAGHAWIAWPGEAWLGVALLLLAGNAAALALSLEHPRARVGRTLALLLLTPLAGAAAYACFRLGTVPALTKYDLTFSAAQFLLGARRDAFLSEPQLLVRGLAAYHALVACLALGGALGARLARLADPLERTPPTDAADSVAPVQVATTRPPSVAAAALAPLSPRDRSLRPAVLPLWLAALALTALAVYASLVPLNVRALPLDDAWRLFVERMTFRQAAPANRFDATSNGILFGGLAFLWMAALAGPRPAWLRRLLAAPLVLVGVVALGAGLELAQTFIPARTVSPVDVLAQAIGAALAIALWLLRGHAWTAAIAGILSPQRFAVLRGLLLLYLLGYVLYGVMPLDLDLRTSVLADKWHVGLIRLVPFTYPWKSPGDAAWNILGDFALALPLGLWLGLGRPPASRLPALLLGLALLLAIETLQAFLSLRVSDSTDLITGGLGVAAGLLVATRGPDLNAPAVARSCLVAAALYALLLLASATHPWHVDPRALHPQAIIDELAVAPLTRLYYGSPFAALDQMLRRLLLAIPLGLLAGLGTPARRGRPAAWLAAAAVAAWMLLVELAQVAVPERTADLTDAGLGALGAWLGWMAARRFLASRGLASHDSPAPPASRPDPPPPPPAV